MERVSKSSRRVSQVDRRTRARSSVQPAFRTPGGGCGRAANTVHIGPVLFLCEFDRQRTCPTAFVFCMIRACTPCTPCAACKSKGPLPPYEEQRPKGPLYEGCPDPRGAGTEAKAPCGGGPYPSLLSLA